MEQEHISFGCSVVSSLIVNLAIVLLRACFTFMNNVHTLCGNCIFLFNYTLCTQCVCVWRNISFLHCYGKVLETLIEDVFAGGICFCLCIVKVNLV
jgi:hypothetical protein